MANVAPKGTLVFTGRNNSAGMRYYSPAGLALTPSADPVPGDGTDGIGVLPTSHCIAIVGGNSPNFGTTGIGIFNVDGTVRAQGAAFSGSPGFGGQGFGLDSSDRFYTYKPSTTAGSLFRWDKDGTALDRYTGVLTTESNFFQGLAINGAGDTAYYGKYKSGTGRRDTIATYPLGGSASELLTQSGYRIESDWSLLCVGSDLIAGWNDPSGVTGLLKRYNASGVLQTDYTSAITALAVSWNPVALTPGVDNTTFWFSFNDWSLSTYSDVRVVEVRISDGAILHNFAPDDGAFDFFCAFAVLLEPDPLPPASCSGGGAISVDADPADGPSITGRTVAPRAWLTLGYDDVDRSLALDSGNHPPASDGRKIGNLVRFGTIKRGLSTHSQPYVMGEADVEVDDSSRLMSTLEATTASQYWANREGRIRLSDLASIATSATPWTLFRGIWRTHDSVGISQRSLSFTSVLGSEFSDFNLERQIADKRIKDVFDGAPKDTQDLTLPIAYGNYPDPSLQGIGDPVAGVTVTLAARPAAPSGFTATATTDGSGRGIDGTLEYYAVTATIGGLESEPAYASASLSGGNNAVDLAWSAYPGATAINLYSAVRSDFLQFAQLPTPLAGTATSYRDIAVLPNQDVDALAATGIWILGLRLNVTWYVYAQLADGTFSAPGVSSTLVLTPISRAFRRRDMTVSWSAYTSAVKYFAIRHVSLYSNWSPRNDLQLTCVPPVVSVGDINNDDALIAGGYADAPGLETPDKPTGTIPAIPCGKETIGGVEYNRLVISIGAWRHVDAIYTAKATSGTDTASSASQETEYDLVASSAYGSTWLAPGQAGWTGPNYRAYNGVWCTVIFTTLDPLPTTVLVNGCGLTDVSDGSGSTIDGAARIFFHCLQNFVLPPADEAWTSGAWLTPRTFTDGTPIINTASLEALETIQISRIGRYYRGQVYIDSPMSLRDFLGHSFTSWNIRSGENEHGQEIGKHLDEFTVLSSAPALTDRADLVGPTRIERRLAELENYITYDYGYRPKKTGQYLKQDQVQSDATAIAANRGHRAVGDHRPMRFVDDPVTAADVIGRDLTFGKYVPVYVTVPVTLEAYLRVKLGQVITVTDVEGIGATGWPARPLWVLDVEVTLNDLETAPEFNLICVDVKRILDGAGEMWDQASAVDWGSASATQQATYMFMADQTTGLLPGGSPAKELR